MKTIPKALRTLAKFLVFFMLLVVLVVIFFPSAMNYDQAGLIKVQTHYELAIRIARSTYARAHSEKIPVPESSTDWILLLNPRGDTAPGGGNAYLADDIDGDPTTGAIGVVSNSRKSVIFARPAYKDFSAVTTTVTAIQQ